jgi:hypothetical protein
MPHAKQLRNSANTLDGRKRQSVASRVLQNIELRLRDHNSPASGLQRIIAHRAGGPESDVNDRSPALQFVVSVTMKKIRSTNGDAGSTSLNECKTGVIIDGVIGQKYFLAAAPSHVQRGEIVQSTGGGNSSE